MDIRRLARGSPATTRSPPAGPRPPPSNRSLADDFTPAPARPPVVITAPQAPSGPLSDGEARARVDGLLSQRLATIEARFQRSANSTAPLDRLSPALRRELNAARDSIVAAQQDPSGTGSIRAAVELMRRELTLNRYSGRLAFDPRFEAATDQLLATVTPERLARDGFAATLSQVVAEVQRLASEVLGPPAPAFPTGIERALGGG